jgi:hypothetical protein
MCARSLRAPRRRVARRCGAPRLANSLRSLAESQLQTQVARSGTFDLGALGVVSVCTAIAAIVLDVRSARHLWIAALLLLLVLALGLAVRPLLPLKLFIEQQTTFCYQPMIFVTSVG